MPIPWQSPNSSIQGIIQGELPSSPPEKPVEWGDRRSIWDRDFTQWDDRSGPGSNRPDPASQWDIERWVGQWWTVNWLEGQKLQDFLQQWVAGVAGLDSTLVRPRWQRVPPNIPDFDTPCWAAVGLQRARPIGVYAWVGHNGRRGIPQRTVWDQLESLWDVRPVADRSNVSEARSEWDLEEGRLTDGYGAMQRHEEMEYLISFYGPDCETVASRLHNNSSVWQNMAILRLVGLAFTETGETVWAPEFIKEQWLNRVDKRLTFRRIVRRDYPILNILEQPFRITADPGGYQADYTAPPRSFWNKIRQQFMR
jgi:hypothetical protein